MEENQMVRVGLIASAYMRQNVNPSELDFSEWIASLEEPMKSAFREKGLENCRGVLNFRRFILEGKDNGMEEFMKENLSPDDYDYWFRSKNRYKHNDEN